MSLHSGPAKRRFRKHAGLLLALPVLIIAAAVVTAKPGQAALYPALDEGVTVYVIDNGFHTDLALPADRLALRPGPLSDAAASATHLPWVAVGWGDASFYTQSGVSAARIADGLRALFAPHNPAVIQLYGIGRDPLTAFARPVATPVHLSTAGFERLAARIEASFVVAGGAPVRAEVHTDPDEAFFRSSEHFSILKVCNNWTGEALNAGGLPITPMADSLSFGLMADLRLRAGVHRPG